MSTSELDAVVDQLRALSSTESVDPLLERRALVAKRLSALVDLSDDAARFGVAYERLLAMLLKQRTLAFGTDVQHSEFLKELRKGLNSYGLAGVIRIIGTATTLFSLNPEKTVSHYFDSASEPSDLDIGLECPTLATVAAKVGIEPKKSKINPAGSFSRETARGRDAGGGRDRKTMGNNARPHDSDGCPSRWPADTIAWITDYALPLG